MWFFNKVLDTALEKDSFSAMNLEIELRTNELRVSIWPFERWSYLIQYIGTTLCSIRNCLNKGDTNEGKLSKTIIDGVPYRANIFISASCNLGIEYEDK